MNPENRPEQQRNLDRSRSAPDRGVSDRRAGAYSPLPDLKPVGGGKSAGGKTGGGVKGLVAALLVAAVAAGVGFYAYNQHDTSSVAPPAPVVQPAPIVQPVVQQQVAQQERSINLSMPEVDLVATAQAIYEIKNSAPTALTANLSDEFKKQILSGERQFYSMPMQSQTVAKDQPSGGSAAPALPPPTSQPDANAGQPVAAQPAASQAAPSPAAQPAPLQQSQGKIRIDINGVLYGIYDSNQTASVALPLALGDSITVTCVSLADNVYSLSFLIADNLGPMKSRPLVPGDSETWTVEHASDVHFGDELSWFQSRAAQGDPVSENGLGYLYQNGWGVTKDLGQAAYWYQKAAAQGNAEAQARLLQLGH